MSPWGRRVPWRCTGCQFQGHLHFGTTPEDPSRAGRRGTHPRLRQKLNPPTAPGREDVDTPWILPCSSCSMRPFSCGLMSSFPDLGEPPIYNVIILACLAVSSSAVLRQLTSRSLSKNPIVACALCLLGSVVLSHLSHFRFGEAINSGIEFIKLLLYFFLLVALLDSFARLPPVPALALLLRRGRGFARTASLLSSCHYPGTGGIPRATVGNDR